MALYLPCSLLLGKTLMDTVLIYFLCPLVVSSAMGEAGACFHLSPLTEYRSLSVALHFVECLSGKCSTTQNPRLRWEVGKGGSSSPGRSAPRPHPASARLSPGAIWRRLYCLLGYRLLLVDFIFRPPLFFFPVKFEKLDPLAPTTYISLDSSFQCYLPGIILLPCFPPHAVSDISTQHLQVFKSLFNFLKWHRSWFTT